MDFHLYQNCTLAKKFKNHCHIIYQFINCMNRTYFKRICQTEPKPNRNLRLIDFRYHQETARQEKSEVYRSREYVAIFSFLLLHAYMYRSSNLDVAKRFFLVTLILKLVCLTCKVRLAYSKERFLNNIFFRVRKKGVGISRFQERYLLHTCTYTI